MNYYKSLFWLSSCAWLPLVVALGCLWQGFALMLLWGWFLVPLGAPSVSFLHACGLCLMARFSTAMASTVGLAKDKDTKPDMVVVSVASGWFFRPAGAIAIGWLIQWSWGYFS